MQLSPRMLRFVRWTRQRRSSTHASRRVRVRIATASLRPGRRSMRGVRSGGRGPSTSTRCSRLPRSCSVSTTSAPSRRRRRGTGGMCATYSRHPGSRGVTGSISRSPQTGFSGTWCARSSGRCSKPAPMHPRASGASSTGGHGRRPASRPLRTASTSSGSTTDPGYDRAVRFRIVLFDLDGTLIDSGPIILASMQHAVRTVLGREIPPDELGLTIGGQGIVAQMTAIDAEHADALLEAYKEHNDGLHETLEAFDELLALLPGLEADGRKLGIVTAKRHRTVGLALDRFPALAGAFDVVVAHEDTERHKPDPDPVLLAVQRLDGVP